MPFADALLHTPRSARGARVLFWSLVLVILGATLYPFQFAIPANLLPDYHKKPVWEPPDGMIFHGVGMFSFQAPNPDVVERIQEAGAFYIYIEALPTVANQYGPSRLFALSRSKVSHAFLVGQHGRDLVFRVRQQPPSSPDRGIFQAVFADACEARKLQAFLITANAHHIRAYRDGELIGEHRLGGRPPAHWDPDNYLVAGNEATGNRAWRGRLRRVELAPARRRSVFSRRQAYLTGWSGRSRQNRPRRPSLTSQRGTTACPKAGRDTGRTSTAGRLRTHGPSSPSATRRTWPIRSRTS